MIAKRRVLALIPMVLAAAGLFTAGVVGVYAVSRYSPQLVEARAEHAATTTGERTQRVASESVRKKAEEAKPQPAVSSPAKDSDPQTSAGAVQGAQPLAGGNRLAGKLLYVPPAPAGRNLGKAAGQPVAAWFGEWSGDVRASVANVVRQAAAVGQVPVLVAYNIPIRDCNGYSSGGAASAAAYKQWIQDLAAGIGDGQVVVILEPDALAGIDCLSEANQAVRYELLSHAVTTLAQRGGASVYIDVGNSGWLAAETVASRVKRIGGYAEADGFALNVSNFYSTASNIVYGSALSDALGGMHFVIDTSRNGNGAISGAQWCNPRGRALGNRPTTSTGHSRVDAYLWVKIPGESDGTCNGGPPAGEWWQEYADELSNNAAY